MIDIKQKDNTLWLINNDYVYTSGMPVKRDELPHLISRLIELGGVGEDVGKAMDDWLESGRNELFTTHILNNYHLIPKAENG